MVKEDLMAHAASTFDFYQLLGVAFETSESDIRRAYRKTALKYHPDKLGKDFDPEKFHLLQIANDVLSDPAAKAAYDNARSARLQKQRQNELFEGKRRQMKEELEAREKGGAPASTSGTKRPREEDEMQTEIQRLAEEGRRRRREMEERLKAQDSSPAVAAKPPMSVPQPPEKPQTAAEEAEEEDEVARLERRIKEVHEAKARRKAEKKARKSGIFRPAESPATERIVSRSPIKNGDGSYTDTPIKRPDLFKDLKADEKSSASPKFSFSPKPMGHKDEFSATMDRLKAAERQRLEDEIRRRETEAAP